MAEGAGDLTECFLAGLRSGPDRVALRVGAQERTYEQMHESACLIGGALRAVADGQERVGVLASATPAVYVGLLAALYAGKAVVPLNPNVPIRRTAGMIAAAGVRTLVVDERGARIGAELPGVRCIAAEPTGWAGAAAADPRARLSGPVGAARDDIAYVMFTSGSTGRPKGVPVSHGNVAHFLDVMRRRYPITPDDVVAQTFEPTFDLFMFGVLMAWNANANLVAAPARVLPRLPNFLSKHAISLWFSVPSTIRLARRMGVLTPGCLPSLTRSLFCGEALTTRDAATWQAAAPRTVLDNLYGPTELTIACTAHRWRPGDPDVNGLVPIGRPFDGLRHLLLDDKLRPVPDEGELCVTGAQMVAGYLDPRDDDGRFVSLDGHRWYRTGDRVRRLADGGLAYLGRLDLQVKVRGYRVELLEVENALRQVPGVQDAAVALVDDAGEAALAAGYVGGAVAAHAVAAALAATLPDYMVPAVIRQVEAVPLNGNGKVDRRALARRLAAAAPTRGE